MEIGVRELKQHLSMYLDRAAAGETIRITDRGRPKAVIGPVGDSEGQLQRGIDEGWIRPAVTPGGIGPVEGHPSTRRVMDVLAEDRGE